MERILISLLTLSLLSGSITANMKKCISESPANFFIVDSPNKAVPANGELTIMAVISEEKLNEMKKLFKGFNFPGKYPCITMNYESTAFRLKSGAKDQNCERFVNGVAIWYWVLEPLRVGDYEFTFSLGMKESDQEPIQDFFCVPQVLCIIVHPSLKWLGNWFSENIYSIFTLIISATALSLSIHQHFRKKII